jgi:hypothetical protein
MKPLLWKEFREVRFQFVLWALAFVFCAATRKIPSFEPAYVTAVGLLIPLGAALVAIAMGASNLIQERRTRTLDFLLTRPASGSQIVWAKFLAGSAVVLYIVSLFAAFIYLQNVDASPGPVLAQAMHEVGFPKLLAVLLPPFWFLYALTILISVLVDESAKAFVTTGAFFIWLFVAGVALSLHPPFLPVGLWFPLSLQTGEWNLVAGNGFLLLAVAATWCSLSILAGALAGRILDKRREPRSNWLVIAACVALPFVLLILGVRNASESAVTVSPAGEYTLSGLFVSSITADGDRVAVLTQVGLEVIDFSDPAHPRLLASVPGPELPVSRVRIAGGFAYIVKHIVGSRPSNDNVLRVNLTGASTPEVERILTLSAMNYGVQIDDLYVIGNYLYLCVGGTRSIRVFDLSATGGARETASVAMPANASSGIVRASRGCSMAVRDSNAYMACPYALLTLDIADPAHPRIVRQTPLIGGTPRAITVAGDALFTQGSFPTRLLRFDLKDPASPVLASETPTGIYFGIQGGIVSDEASSTLMVAFGDGVLAFRPPTGLLLHDVRYLKPSEPSAQHIAIGKRYFYALIEGNRVAAFPLPRIN